MFIRVRLLRTNRDFRLLFLGQMISLFGSMVSYVAVPYQVYEMTHDNAMVGWLGIVQLVPVLLFGVLGGTYADRINRRKLLLVSEFLMCCLSAGLVWNAFLPSPSLTAIFVLVALHQSVLGFHRPAMDALSQFLVEPKDYTEAGSLSSLRFSLGAITGPALGGVLIAAFGVQGAFLFDLVSFWIALTSLALMSRTPDPEKREHSTLRDAKEGLAYAFSKPELIGTYLIDIVAMVFAFPMALFPAMSVDWGGAKTAGLLFSAMSVGALVMTLLSGWTHHVKAQGRAVVLAATGWGVFIFGLGHATTLMSALVFLFFAGAADMISGLFRGVIWNESIPNRMRGRLAGIEMISYMSGPLLGNARAGWMAAHGGVSWSITSGGAICTVAVILTACGLPKFWAYRGTKAP